MFLLIPFLFLILSTIGVAVIIFRKKNYLNKLSTLNTSGNGGSSVTSFSWKAYGTDFFPEIKILIDRVEFSKYRAHWLVEVEKFFRKARVLSLRMDRISDLMIKKIRRIHLNDKLNGHISSESEVTETSGDIIENSATNIASSTMMSKTFLKNEEERLIIEIAKNPKDASLYELLGDLYFEMEGWTDAKESYEAAIELSPQNVSLKQKLSSALEKIIQK